MTEASKARKRHPMMVVRAPMLDMVKREELVRYLNTMGHAVLPPGATVELIRTRASTPPHVVTTGISCRMGVGGRRGRKRRAARVPPRSSCSTGRRRPLPGLAATFSAQFTALSEAMRKAGKAITAGFLSDLTPAARAPTAGAPISR